MSPSTEKVFEMGEPVLSVSGLRVVRGSGTGRVVAADGVGFDLHRGETVAIVGESGSGKSSLAGAIAGLLPSRSTWIDGSIRFMNTELLQASPAVWNTIRGKDLGIVFQDQAVSLNPMMKVGKQVAETIEVHRPDLPRHEVLARVRSLLEDVGIGDPDARVHNYPYELSGGMRQRILLALAVANSPALLIADEPTTALDVTIQAQVLKTLKEIQRSSDMAMIFITHNLGIVADIADRVLVMRGGRVVESGPTSEVFGAPQHPYTAQLLASIPRIGTFGSRTDAADRSEDPRCAPALEVSGLVKTFARPRLPGGARADRRFNAVDGVSFRLAAGETLSIVGESGSGKTTLARCVAGLADPTAGEIRLAGRLAPRKRSPGRVGSGDGGLQFVFQDPFESLDPSWTVQEIVEEPLRREVVNRRERERRVRNALESVSLPAASAAKRPKEFSGGERQRISIARAIVRKPRVLILDEPTASLDVSIQAKVVELLRHIQETSDIAFLFITHDLALASNLSDHVAVMRHGVIVEYGTVRDIFERPRHDYTRQLLAAGSRSRV